MLLELINNLKKKNSNVTINMKPRERVICGCFNYKIEHGLNFKLIIIWQLKLIFGI